MAQPVTVAEAKLFLRVEHEVEDGLIQSRPVAADGGGVEQKLTLTGVSRFAGSEEAKAVAAAGRCWAVQPIWSASAGRRCFGRRRAARSGRSAAGA
jgi:hypothetical protein